MNEHEIVSEIKHNRFILRQLEASRVEVVRRLMRLDKQIEAQRVKIKNWAELPVKMVDEAMEAQAGLYMKYEVDNIEK